ncbi:MAG: hypothetical protein HYS12_16595, partial [Planctomycetes bacterium]|nr:hypothetical protein [Planctomycetota bacterium]
MPIKVQCDCGRTMTVRDELAGKLARCPACKRPVRVPSGKPKLQAGDEEDRLAR